MEAVWAAERTTAREAADALAERRGWAYSTVKTMLDRMVEKGLVNARQVGSVWEYTPAVARAQARRHAWRRFIDKAFDGATAPALAFLAGEADLTKKERDALRKMLDKMEGES